MTTEQLAEYYSNLLVIQYNNKPNFIALVQSFVTPVLKDQVTLAVQNAFNINSAVGVQLDVLGKYVGVTRNGIGFTGPITLTDAEFSQLILLAIIRNNSGSSLYDIQALLVAAFGSAIVLRDHLDMRLSVMIDSSKISSNVAQLFFSEELFPKPMGVQLSVPVYTTPINIFFGFRSAKYPLFNATPFNTVTSYNMSSPWLSVQDGLMA